MIHAIIFANRENGNQLYEHTPDFPPDAAEKILDLCNCMVPASSDSETAPVVRYQPLDGRYLLSVVQRLRQGNETEIRSHVVSVNFLMDAPEADHFFRLPFPRAVAKMTETAQALLAIRNTDLPLHLCQDFLWLPEEAIAPCRSATPLDVLLTGASYAFDRKLTRQLFVESTCSPVDELNNLLRILPPLLRKELSFHTGCAGARECDSLGLCYCPQGTLSRILASDFEGGPSTTKFWYFAETEPGRSKTDDRLYAMVNRLIQIPNCIPLYGVLQDAVTDWDVYRELSLLVSDQPPLRKVLQVLPEDAVLRIIRRKNLSPDQLAQLAKAAGFGSPIRKAAKAAQSRSQTSH